MIEINVPASSVVDPDTNRIYRVKKDQKIQLEHSLISIQKWESRWHIAYLKRDHQKTYEQIIDYIRCMTLTPNVADDVYYCIPDSELKRVAQYIDDPMSATRVHDAPPVKSFGIGQKQDVVTAEVIYYWMIAMNIPYECRKWHLQQLLTLIRVINAKNAPKKKRPMKDVLAEYRSINEENKKRFGTKG